MLKMIFWAYFFFCAHHSCDKCDKVLSAGTFWPYSPDRTQTFFRVDVSIACPAACCCTHWSKIHLLQRGADPARSSQSWWRRRIEPFGRETPGTGSTSVVFARSTTVLRGSNFRGSSSLAEMQRRKQRTGRKCQTSGDFTHLRDGRLICGDAAELLVVWRGCSRQSQDQSKQPLVPAERLFGELAASQRGVQGQVQLHHSGSFVGDIQC